MNGHDEMDVMDGGGVLDGLDGGASAAGPSGLIDSVRTVSFDTDYMYPPSSLASTQRSSPPFDTHFASSSGTSPDNGKGKGRAREVDDVIRNGAGVGAGIAGEEHIASVKREEFVRVILQALRDVGYSQTASVLEAESGYEQEPVQITAFKAAIAGGRWSESIRLLEELGVIQDIDKVALRRSSSSVSMRSQVVAGSNGGGGGLLGDTNGSGSGSGPGSGSGSMMASSAPVGGTLGSLSRMPSTDGMQLDEPHGSTAPRHASRADGSIKESPGRQALFMILQQKYLELLEANQTKRALAVLRTELAPLAAHTDRLHMLSGFIMCLDKEELYVRAGWDGVAGRSRGLLLQQLQAFLRPGMMIPPRRLANLFDQARRHQELNCMYHTSDSVTSLLADHQCQRNAFPTVSTHILADHSDEVWVIEWSHDGQYIASGGKDSNVIIWKIGPAPARHCEKVITLKSNADDVTSISWSPDDSRLLVAADTNLYLWDTKSGTQVCTLSSLHKDVISAVQWLPGKGGFVSAGMDMKLMFWTWEGSLNRTWPTVPLRIHDFVVTPDGKRVIAIAVLNEVKADGRGQKPVASRSPDRVAPDGLGLGGQPVAIGKMDRHIVIYDFDTGKIVGHSRRNVPAELTSISLSKDCKSILLSCSPDELQLWSIENDALTFVRKYTGHRHRHFHLRSCFGGRDRNFVVSGSEDSLVYVWHNDTAALLEVLEGHSLPVNSVAWNPVYPDIFASCSDDKTIRIWQPPSVADAIAEDSSSAAARPPTSWRNGVTLPAIIPVSPMPREMDLAY